MMDEASLEHDLARRWGLDRPAGDAARPAGPLAFARRISRQHTRILGANPLGFAEAHAGSRTAAGLAPGTPDRRSGPWVYRLPGEAGRLAFHAWFVRVSLALSADVLKQDLHIWAAQAPAARFLAWIERAGTQAGLSSTPRGDARREAMPGGQMEAGRTAQPVPQPLLGTGTGTQIDAGGSGKAAVHAFVRELLPAPAHQAITQMFAVAAPRPVEVFAGRARGRPTSRRAADEPRRVLREAGRAIEILSGQPTVQPVPGEGRAWAGMSPLTRALARTKAASWVQEILPGPGSAADENAPSRSVIGGLVAGDGRVTDPPGAILWANGHARPGGTANENAPSRSAIDGDATSGRWVTAPPGAIFGPGAVLRAGGMIPRPGASDWRPAASRKLVATPLLMANRGLIAEALANGEAAEEGDASTARPALTFVRRAEIATPPELSYIYARPARAAADEPPTIRPEEEREVAALVQREVAQAMTREPALTRFSRGDYVQIADQVYAVLARRLTVEAERVGWR